MIYLVFLQILILSSVCVGQNSECQTKIEYSSKISTATQSASESCWIITVPKDSYIRLDTKESDFSIYDCSQAFIRITVVATGEELRSCAEDKLKNPIIALSDVQITFITTNIYYLVSFKLNYNIENLICAQKDSFRCSRHSCIHQYQVCDALKNCENGSDEIGCETGIAAVKGANVSLETSVVWLKKQLSTSGWGKNTPRAVTALYLAGNLSFQNNTMEEELIAKLLELETSVALLRNSTDPVSISDLSMFINALTVTCHNPHQFYGYDLLNLLSKRVAASKLPNPGPHLTLCNANMTIPLSHTEKLLKVLHKHSGYPFHLDIQAMALMALTCIIQKTDDFDKIENATEVYENAIQEIITTQLPDGSFGNIYTTALVTQALITSEQENNTLWKMNSTVQFLMQELASSKNLLTVCLTLPVFNGKSLGDISSVKCANRRKHGKVSDITDVTNKLGGKMYIQYSLYVGDQKDVIHTMYLRMPQSSSVYDVMRMAQVSDPKYKFIHRDVAGHMYIYEIDGIPNDPESGKYWLLYISKGHVEENVKHIAKSPDNVYVEDGEHLIMWYKTAHI